VVHDVDLELAAGEVTVLLGANGAGKTTLLCALAGADPVRRLAGKVDQEGRPIAAPLHLRARRGLGYVPEIRGVIRSLRVDENLRLGGGSVERAVVLFPELKPLLARPAGLLSGGEQQILSLARTLARAPSVILADEVSLGLSPQVTTRLITALRDAATRGASVLMVEQHTRQALSVADRGYVLHGGRIALQGATADLSRRLAEIEAAYLSTAPAQEY
jgi:ABC-type branched-subunit amino acid transport system ATPase component